MGTFRVWHAPQVLGSGNRGVCHFVASVQTQAHLDLPLTLYCGAGKGDTPVTTCQTN